MGARDLVLLPRIEDAGNVARTSYGSATQALEEGNPLDRTIFLLLTLTAFVILVSRSFQWRKFVAQNPAPVVRPVDLDFAESPASTEIVRQGWQRAART